MMKKNKTRKFFYKLLFLTLILLNNSVSALDWNGYKASNYHNLIGTENSIEKLKNLLKGDRVFLIVSGCHLDEEAMPAFIEMSKKYPKAVFVRISQHGETNKFMNENYLSHGAPKLYAFGNDSLVGQLFFAYSFKNGRKFLGWEKSIENWTQIMYPILDKMAQLKNVKGVSSFSSSKIFDNRIILLRENAQLETFPQDVDFFLEVASQNPSKSFFIDTKTIEYNQLFDYRYLKIHNSISIVEKHRVYASLRQGSGYSIKRINNWLSENYRNRKPVNINIPQIKNSGDVRRAIQDFRSDVLSSAPANIILQYRKLNRTLTNPNFMQTFYVVLNSVTDAQRNPETSKELLQILYFKEAGGIKKFVPSPILRKKIYSTIFERLSKEESNPSIQKELLKLAETYSK